MKLKQNDKLYLVDYTSCDIVIGIYMNPNDDLYHEDYHKISIKTGKSNTERTLMFTNYTPENADGPCQLKVNQVITKENFFSKLVTSHSCNNHSYLIFNNEKQAIEVLKKFVVPLHIEREQAIAESHKNKYMDCIVKIEKLESLMKLKPSKTKTKL